MKKKTITPKSSAFRHAFLTGVFSVLCGCASLPTGFLSQKYLHQTPSEQEAEVYRKIIRDYSVGDWLYEIGGEGGNHVDRAYFQSREGNIPFPPEDMEHAKRLIKAIATFRVSGIYQDCWLSGMFDTDYQSCIRRNESGGRMPFPKCLAFYGYPVSKNHKAPDAYFKEAGIRTPFFEGDALENDSEKRLERELKEVGFDLGGSWLSDFRATLEGKEGSQIAAEMVKLDLEKNKIFPGFVAPSGLKKHYQLYVVSKIVERSRDDVFKMRDELAEKIAEKKSGRKFDGETILNFAPALDGAEDGIEVPPLHILFGPIRTISEKEMKGKTAVCLKMAPGGIVRIEPRKNKYPEKDYIGIYWTAYSRTGKRYLCNGSALVEEKDMPVTCNESESWAQCGTEELKAWNQKKTEEFGKQLDEEYEAIHAEIKRKDEEREAIRAKRNRQ